MTLTFESPLITRPNHHNFYILFAFHIFVAGNRRDFKLVCGLSIASRSLQMTNRPEMGVITSHDPV